MGGDADAGIDDLEAQLAGGPNHLDADHDLAHVRELDGVADEIDQNLTQASRIAADFRRHVRIDRADQFQALGVRTRGADFDRLFDGFAQTEIDALEFELAGFDLGEIENVVDDLQQRFGGMPDGLRQVPLPRRQLGRLQQLRHADDPVHRGADLMTHAREEFALGAAGALRRFLGARRLIDDLLQLGICLAEILGAFRHLLLEELPILFQA